MESFCAQSTEPSTAIYKRPMCQINYVPCMSEMTLAVELQLGSLLPWWLHVISLFTSISIQIQSRKWQKVILKKTFLLKLLLNLSNYNILKLNYIWQHKQGHNTVYFLLLFMLLLYPYQFIIYQQLVYCRIYTNISNDSIEYLTDESLLETMFSFSVRKYILVLKYIFSYCNKSM